LTLRHNWYEKLFFRLQMRERKCIWIIICFFLIIMLIQILLTNSDFRRSFVLTEKYEGEPVKFYKSLKAH
jgi:hypothetical protein